MKIDEKIVRWALSFPSFTDVSPWFATQNIEEILCGQQSKLGVEYSIENGIAIHRSARVETGAVLKGPMIIGANCFIASSAYLRGGVFMDDNCIVGPACELKTVYMFEHSKIAHLSFVGDSIIGARSNVEAGAIIANYRNELEDKKIQIFIDDEIIETGVDKFGSFLADDVRIGANSVIAPGAILDKGQIVPRLTHIDMHPFKAPN